MLKTELDHFVIAAKTLEQGVNYVQSKLGVIMPFGGKHPKMGTHNHLMNLGNTFLEIIAINPDQQPQRTPRWFNLDSSKMQEKLAESPQLITWVARTNNIEKAISQTTISLGKIETVSRGNLTWKITVPEDGLLPKNGIFPTLIQWPENVKPWESMQNLGYSFHELQLHHSTPDTITRELRKIGILESPLDIIKNKQSDIHLHLTDQMGNSHFI